MGVSLGKNRSQNRVLVLSDGYDLKNTILVGHDAVQHLALKFYGDVDPADQVYLYNTDKVGFNAAGYEGDSFECFVEDAYANIIDNALKSWLLANAPLSEFVDALLEKAAASPISPLEEQAYLLLAKMLGGDRTGDPFFDEFTPYGAISIGKAQTGGDLAIIFMPKSYSKSEMEATADVIRETLKEKPIERMNKLVDLAAGGAIGILREEIKAVTLGSDTFLNLGEKIRLDIDKAIIDMCGTGATEPIDFRTLRNSELKTIIADKNSPLRASLLNIYDSISRLQYNGEPLVDGYKEIGFKFHSPSEVAKMSDEEIIKLFSGHTFRKAFSLARKDSALKSSASAVNTWTRNLKKKHIENRMHNFSQLTPQQQQGILILEAAMTFTGLRDEKIIADITQKIKNNDNSWRDSLYLASAQAYIDITRTGHDANGSFIEYHEGFRTFLENIIGFGKKKNQYEMVVQTSKNGQTLQYGVKDKNGKITILYGQANNTSVDENNLFGKMTFNHKPARGFTKLFPCAIMRLN